MIPVPGFRPIDLVGVHYLHQLNSWLYMGLGAHAPLVKGDYGGFMAFDATIHAQQKIVWDLFIDAGVSFGGGGGGSSIKQSRVLSGTGGFTKSYIGLGYDFGSFSAGANYTHFRFMNSQINHSQLNLFLQKPVSYAVGSYAAAGQQVESDFSLPDMGENILTLELNNIFQLKPQASYKKTIHTLYLQLSHYLTESHYLFFGADVGYRGLPLYNQILAGVGYRYAITPRFNVYGQIGVGSGGYSPAEIDTGSGLLVQPKVSLEYLLNHNLGLSVSSGYLVAPKGTSKNITVGAALNYRLSGKEKNRRSFSAGQAFRGFRFNLFEQTEFDVRVGNSKHANLNMLSAQFDYIVNDYWYLPTRASVAFNEFVGFPGYGEILTGIGLQSKFSTANSFQGFLQILIGANVHGIILKPSVGVNYGLSDKLALYGQFGKTISLNKIGLYPDNQLFSSYSAGLGLTYRFSLLN